MNALENKVAVVTGSSKGIGASIARHFAAEGASVVVNYASSKDSADSVVKEIRGKGGTIININSILPGATETGGAINAGVTPSSEYEKMFIANTPLGRRGQPKDIAKAAVFLASDDAAWITGEQLSVSGGMYGFESHPFKNSGRWNQFTCTDWHLL